MHSTILLGFSLVFSSILESAVHTAGHVIERRAIVLQDHEAKDYACWKHGKGDGFHSEKSQPVSQCSQTVTRDVDDCSKYSVCLVDAYAAVGQTHKCACGDGHKFSVTKQQCVPQNQVTDCPGKKQEDNSVRGFHNLKDLIRHKLMPKTVGVKDEKLEHMCQYVGKFPLETSCDGYVQCELGAGGKLEAFKYDCPEGKQYSKNFRICMHPAFARCPFSKSGEQNLGHTRTPALTTSMSTVVRTTPGKIFKSSSKHYEPSSTTPSTLALPSTTKVMQVTTQPYVLTSAMTSGVITTRKLSTIPKTTTKVPTTTTTVPTTITKVPTTTTTVPTTTTTVPTTTTKVPTTTTKVPTTTTTVPTTTTTVPTTTTTVPTTTTKVPTTTTTVPTTTTKVPTTTTTVPTTTTKVPTTTTKVPTTTTTVPKFNVYSVNDPLAPASEINEPVRMQKVTRLETGQVQQIRHLETTKSTTELPPVVSNSYSSTQPLPSQPFSLKENDSDSTSKPDPTIEYSRPTKERPTYTEEFPEYREDTLEYVDKDHDYDSYRIQPVYSQEQVDYSFEEAPDFEDIMEDMEEGSQVDLLFEMDMKGTTPNYGSLLVPPSYVDQKTRTNESHVRPLYADKKAPVYKPNSPPSLFDSKAPSYSEKGPPIHTAEQVPVHVEIPEPTYRSNSSPIYEKSRAPVHTELGPPTNTVIVEPAYNSSKDSVYLYSSAPNSPTHSEKPSPVYALHNVTNYHDPDPPTYTELQDKIPIYNRKHLDYTLEAEPEADTDEDIDYVHEDPPEYYHEDDPDYYPSSVSSLEELGLSGKQEASEFNLHSPSFN